MQRSELLIIVLGISLFFLALTSIKSDLRLSAGLITAVSVVVLGQLYYGGYRWHMLPAYLAVAILLALLSASKGSSLATSILMAASLVLLAGATALTISFPVFALPRVTGLYGVGTTTLDVQISADGLGEVSRSKKENTVVVQFYYPTDRELAHRSHAHYMSRIEAPRIASQLSLVPTEAVVNAKLPSDDSRFPILIYAHSWNGNRHENTYLLQELASHGYVVASYDDPYDTPTTLFADGRVVRNEPNAEFLEFSSPEKFRRTRKVLYEHLLAGASDVRSLLDELIRMNANSASRFYQRLDTARLAVLGFSFGGTIAAEVCRSDPRFQAGLNLDGYTFGIGPDDKQIRQPLMVMWEAPESNPPPINKDESDFGENDYRQIVSAVAARNGNFFEIEGTQHRNFSESPLYCRLARYGGGGSIEPHRALKIVSAYVLAFFDEHVRGVSSTYPGSLEYPEIKSRVVNSPAQAIASAPGRP